MAHVRRRTGLLRQIRLDATGRHVVQWRGALYHHDALELLPERTTVAVVAASAFSVAVYRQRVPQRPAPAPLCLATITRRPQPTDRDQTALDLSTA